MKKYFLSLIMLILFVQGCENKPSTIPTGTWKYKLLMNEVVIGSAVISNQVVNNNYVSTSEMKTSLGNVANSSKQIITETNGFKPVKIEIYNKIINNGNINEINTIATFDGNKVLVDTGDSKATFTIKKPFILEGNFIISELIKKGFQSGTEVTSYIYDPSLELEEPVLIKIKVLGRENIAINKKMENLIHIQYSIENLKNIDLYINDKGITQKTIIKMLNNRLELEID